MNSASCCLLVRSVLHKIGLSTHEQLSCRKLQTWKRTVEWKNDPFKIQDIFHSSSRIANVQFLFWFQEGYTLPKMEVVKFVNLDFQMWAAK